MKRIKIICANWKMNQVSRQAVVNFGDALRKLHYRTSNPNLTVAIAPSSPYLAVMTNYADQLTVVSQDCCFAEAGAYTGEVSVLMLVDLRVKMCLVGHSERRNLFFESDQKVNAKLTLLLKHHIKPILCIGESLAVRNNNNTMNFLQQQLTTALTGVSLEQASQLVIAYEPVWAIGSGRSANPGQIQHLIMQLRRFLAGRFSQFIAERIPIMYGGSVDPQNASHFLRQPDIDGLLVGGASLNYQSFEQIINCVGDDDKN